MANPPDDTPPTRKSGRSMPPFVAPRTGEHPAAPPPKRRSTPLFVPPTVAPTEPPIIERAISDELAENVEADDMPEFVTPPESAEPIAAPPPPAPPRETRGLEVENLEVEEISLHITGERPAIGDSEIDVIAYDDANGELDARAKQGDRPKVDGLELESTELTMEPSGQAPPPVGLEIESFWAAEAFTPSNKPAETTRRPSGPSAPVYADPPGETPPRKSALDALRVEEVLPPRMPTPQSTRAVSPRGTPRASGSVPMSRAMTPSDVRTPRQLESLKELEPWAVPSSAPQVPASDRVAEALERIARRIRAGDVDVPTDANAATDENALSAALQALVRAPRR